MSLIKLTIIFSFSTILVFIFVILCSTFIYTAIKLAFASIAFWIKFSQSYLFIVYQLSNFAKYPITIYPKAIKIILTYIIPFAFTVFYPGAYFLGKGSLFTGIIMTFIIALLSISVAYYIWLKGISIYESAGN